MDGVHQPISFFNDKTFEFNECDSKFLNSRKYHSSAIQLLAQALMLVFS
jgi:hypothetical protein